MAGAAKIAVKLLEHEGISGIWELHMQAARLYGEGRQDAAEWLLRIADAAEENFRRRAQALSGLI